MLSTGRKDSNAALQTQCCVNQGRSTLRCPLLKVVLLGQVQARQPHHEIGSDPPGCPRLTQAAICSPNQTLSFQKEKSQKCYLTPQNKTKTPEHGLLSSQSIVQGILLFVGTSSSVQPNSKSKDTCVSWSNHGAMVQLQVKKITVFSIKLFTSQSLFRGISI
jgi:hypothetical protein